VRYAIVPLNDGEENLITTSAVSSHWFWWVSWAVLGLGLGVSYDAERRMEPAWFELPQGSPLARA
jgi:hypothetical protein